MGPRLGRSAAINVLAPARLLRSAVRHFRERAAACHHLIELERAARQHQSAHHRLRGVEGARSGRRRRRSRAASRRTNILAYVIAPGVVRTRMSEECAAIRPGGEAAVTATLAMGEWVPPEEIGHLVAFLATGRVRHLTGATLDVNGASYVR